MSKRYPACQWPIRAAAVTIAWVLCIVPAGAAEQRCAELGASCICSEPLNTGTFTGGPPSWNPADSTTKQCSAEGEPGGAIARNTRDLAGSTDAAALGALPPGHGVSQFLRAGEGHNGIFFVGNGMSISPSLVRIAARWYIYYTPTFEFVDEGACENTKITEHSNGSRISLYIEGGNLTFNTYGYDSFTPSIDCCVTGPGPNVRFPLTQFKGKWWRFEVVMSNRSGPNFDMKFYGKNVTDDSPEYLILDLASDGRVNKLTPPGLMSAILVNNYRQGTCRGWLGISHYLMAGWTTNAGQRIGPAAEVESPGSIVPPSNLRVSELADQLQLLKLSSLHTLLPDLRDATGLGQTITPTARPPLRPSR